MQSRIYIILIVLNMISLTSASTSRGSVEWIKRDPGEISSNTHQTFKITAFNENRSLDGAFDPFWPPLCT